MKGLFVILPVKTVSLNRSELYDERMDGGNVKFFRRNDEHLSLFSHCHFCMFFYSLHFGLNNIELSFTQDLNIRSICMSCSSFHSTLLMPLSGKSGDMNLNLFIRKREMDYHS